MTAARAGPRQFGRVPTEAICGGSLRAIKGKAAALAVYLVYAARADSHFTAWMSEAAIAGATGLTSEAIRQARRQLERVGLLVNTDRREHRCIVYRLSATPQPGLGFPEGRHPNAGRGLAARNPNDTRGVEPCNPNGGRGVAPRNPNENGGCPDARNPNERPEIGLVTPTSVGINIPENIGRKKARAQKSKSACAFTADQIKSVYAEYPRKIGKAAALKAIARALKAIAKADDPPADPVAWLIERVRQFAQSPAGLAGRFTPHPASWFNAERYDDDPDEWNRQSDNHVDPQTERRQRKVAQEFPEPNLPLPVTSYGGER